MSIIYTCMLAHMHFYSMFSLGTEWANSIDAEHRYSLEGLNGLLFDLHVLASSSFFVGTFSSQVCIICMYNRNRFCSMPFAIYLLFFFII